MIKDTRRIALKKLLLIDTSEQDKEIIKSALDVEFDVIVAKNGTEGLSILDTPFLW